MKTKSLTTTIFLVCTTLLFAQVQLPFELPFTPYENNPVLENGDPGSWDDGYLLWSFMFTENDTCYLYYTATEDPYTQPGAIGLAKSTNGYDFDKCNHNPVFEPADLGFDMGSVCFPVVMKDNEDYILYYNGRLNPDATMGENIGRATADNPEWPWAREDQPIIQPGGTGEWDSHGCLPESVIETDSGLLMYYTAGHSINHFRVGMAYLPEGGTDWIKFDDPNTTGHPFMESDPVLNLGEPGDWDEVHAALCSVYKTTSGLEMFYSGGSAADHWNIGYATSEDGIDWIKYSGNPIFTYQRRSFS
ncbi:MAG: hypothetical protein R2750_03960 [Bacteroidales bacterium]